MTLEKAILIDMLMEHLLTISATYAKIKVMSDEEVKEALAAENIRSQQLKDLLKSK